MNLTQSTIKLNLNLITPSCIFYQFIDRVYRVKCINDNDNVNGNACYPHSIETWKVQKQT